jgi:hypothetical protein
VGAGLPSRGCNAESPDNRRDFFVSAPLACDKKSRISFSKA